MSVGGRRSLKNSYIDELPVGWGGGGGTLDFK